MIWDKKKEALQLIREMSFILNDGALKPEEILHIVLQALDREMGFRNSMILLVNEERDQLLCVSARGANANARPVSVPMGRGIVGVAAQKGNILRINNIGSEILYSKAVLSQTGLNAQGEQLNPGNWAFHAIQSQLAIPLYLHGEVIGVLSVQSENRNAFDDLDEELLTILANQTTQVVNAIRTELLHRKQKDLLTHSFEHLHILQKYMESLSNVLPGQTAYSRAAALQLKGLTHLAMGESQLAFEQLESALKLWEKPDLPLEVILSKHQKLLPMVDLKDAPLSNPKPGEKLSKREMEVARLVAIGLSNAEIAEKLYVSTRTVTTHLERIYRKLDIHSRVALAHYMTNPP